MQVEMTFKLIWFHFLHCTVHYKSMLGSILINNKNTYELCISNPPALPCIPLSIPARLGRDLLLRWWWSFSMDRYLLLMWAGTTKFSRSLFWILGGSFSPSFWSRACLMSSCWSPWASEIAVVKMNSWMNRAMTDLMMPVNEWMTDWSSEGLYTV